MSETVKLFDNLGLKALSLLLAVALWLFVTAEMEGEVEVTAPVRFKGLSPRFSLAGTAPLAVELRIAGPKILLWQLDKGRLTATLDLRGVGEGGVAFTNLEKTVSLRNGLRITRIHPSAIELKLAEKRSPAPSVVE